MVLQASYFQGRFDSLKQRAVHLTQLKDTVAQVGLSTRQWALLDSSLASLSSVILWKLRLLGEELLPAASHVRAARALNTHLGALELTVANAYNFFDTYMDVLTQRLSPELGKLLKGCDVLASDALNVDHPAMASVEKPIVYCDRGFGASILREGIPFFGLTTNPFPLIQIPYSKLKDKCNLTSILHEAGHQAFVRLGLRKAFPLKLKENLARAGAATPIQDYFALWCSELVPDFWAFATAGAAQAIGIREILSLPPTKVFHVQWGDPHPPPYLRVLIAFAWCKAFFGRGPWDGWRDEWMELYPLDEQDTTTADVLQSCLQYVPVLLQTIERQSWDCLGGRTLTSLFNIDRVSPATLLKVAATWNGSRIDFTHTRPCAQLGVFRQLQLQRTLDGQRLDAIMGRWLAALGQQRTTN